MLLSKVMINTWDCTIIKSLKPPPLVISYGCMAYLRGSAALARAPPCVCTQLLGCLGTAGSSMAPVGQSRSSPQTSCFCRLIQRRSRASGRGPGKKVKIPSAFSKFCWGQRPPVQSLNQCGKALPKCVPARKCEKFGTLVELIYHTCL